MDAMYRVPTGIGFDFGWVALIINGRDESRPYSNIYVPYLHISQLVSSYSTKS
jgi:hypothetical protein